MFRNYLLTAFRNLNRNKLFSIINIIGLSLGLACVMLIILYSKDEVSFDRFHEKGPQIYRVVNERIGPDKKSLGTSGNTGMVQGPAFSSQIPEVETFVRLQPERTAVKVNDQIFEQDGLYVDSNFFSVFSFPLSAGNKDKALSNKHSVVLSEEVAKKFFGKADAMGKTIALPLGKDGAFETFSVTGIAPKSPQNSSIKIEMLLPIHLNNENGDRNNWINFYLNTFLVLKPGADVKKVEAQMARVYLTDARQQLENARKEFNMDESRTYGLQPFAQMHLSTEYIADNGLNNASNPLYSRILGGIAIFILVIACINFVNLSVARSLKRAKEVGIRKVIGGERKQLMFQFMLESTLLCFIAFSLAVAITHLSLPVFNELANKALAISYLLDVKLVAFYLLLFAFTSFLAGFYPSLVLSGFNPVKTLYNRTRFAGKNYLSQGLVVLQFTLTTFLIIATITIYRQFNYLTARDLGYNDRNVVLVRTSRMQADKLNVFKTELMKNPSVVAVAGRHRGTWGTMAKVNDENMDFTIEVVDPDFLPLYEVPILKGRNFSSSFPSDSTQSVLINEAFAQKAGWKEPIGKVVDFFYDSLKYNVVGMIRNYHHESLLSEIAPQLFIMHPKYDYGMVLIKIKPESTSATLKHIEKVFRNQNPLQPWRYDFKDDLNRKQYEAEARWKDIISFAAFITIFISCIGLFGLATLAAEKRIKEIGIRKVLGASVQSITGMLTTKFVKLVMVAAIIAFPAAWFSLNQWLQNYPFRIGLDWWIFGLAGLVVLCLALSTVSFQAIKAAVANPVKSLRTE